MKVITMKTYRLRKVAGEEKWEIWYKQELPYKDKGCIQWGIESKELATELKKIYQRHEGRRFTVVVIVAGIYTSKFGVIDNHSRPKSLIMDYNTYEIAKEAADAYESHYSTTGE